MPTPKRTRMSVCNDIYYHAVGLARYAAILEKATPDARAYEKLVAMEIDKLNVLFNELSQQEEEADGPAIAFG